MKKEITILQTWDNEEIILEVEFSKWIATKTEAKSKGEDGILNK